MFWRVQFWVAIADWVFEHFRLIPYALYLLAVVGLGYLVGTRMPTPSHTVSAFDLPANHRLQFEDLVPADRAALAGQYLRRAVKYGEPITTENISPQPLFVDQPNAIAAIITVAKATAWALRLDIGMKIQICRGTRPFGGPATVAAKSCGERDCSVTLILPKMSDSIDPASLADARLAVTSQPKVCEG